jgi:uncharacterized protein
MPALPEVAQQNLSPCIRVCSLNAHSICVGCGRTLDEIARWARLGVDEQRTICAIAAQRRQQIAKSTHQTSFSNEVI